MFKKTIKFEDFNGEEQEKDFYFHLSTGDIARLKDMGLQEKMEDIAKREDVPGMLLLINELIRMSAGTRSTDGSRFDKSEAAQAELLETAAYDALVLSFVEQPGSFVEFCEGLIPKQLRNKLPKVEDSPSKDMHKVDLPDERPAWQREHRHPTKQELRAMDKDELLEAFRLNPGLRIESGE